MTGEYPTPPTAPPSWSYTPQHLTSTIESTISTTRALIDSIVALPKDERTFETVFRPLALREGEAARESEPALFLQYVSTEKEVRDASVEGDKQMQDFGLDTDSRIDLYTALLDAKEHTTSHNISLNAEEQRLMARMIRDRERNGLGLPEDKRTELLEVKKKINSLAIDFQRACNEEKGFLDLTQEELEGVPKSVMEGYEKTEKGYKVTYKTPDIIPVFKYANLPSTRKRAVLGYEGKTIQNVPVLAEIVRLRRQVAALLGWDTYAGYVLDVKMAKKPERVFEDLETKLKPLGEAEKKKLLELKKSVHLERGWPVEEELWLWDYRYYDRLFVERELNLDEEALKSYFSVSKVVPTILDIYRTLLGVKFFKVPRDEKHGGQTWHEDAEMYAVWDSKGEDETGEFLGYMHLDLFPRENKYGHAAVWGLIPGWTAEDGTRNYPVVNMVANLAKATPTTPALMKHDSVVTFFHEFGHAFHGLCSKTQFARFHGTSVARDFVEAPSQMLEHWCWTKDQLKQMSSHYETGEPLSDELIANIIKSKNVNQGLFNLRQLFHGKYDMLVHTSKKDQDMTKLWVDLREKTSLVSTSGDAGGYEAGYYGYLYSQAFSADMFKTVFKDDPMSPKNGAHYRKEILQPGGSREEMDSLVAFLGREPNNVAFLEDLMGSSESATPPKL
ncbi:metallopeptidase MepB [Pseudohyphozyma bogoriensis]|nr:metallopeptidase MepB [Pseudohyphozyma bogoriensis]